MNSDLTDPKSCLFHKGKAITVKLTDRLSVRIYEDCSPHCMETSTLQKGIIVTLDGKELIEEGLGFGVPVVKYRDKTYFSSFAEASFLIEGTTVKVTKKYVLDTVSRKKLWRSAYIDDDLYSSVRKTFAILYLTKKQMSPFFNTVMELREAARIKTEFIKVKNRGVVEATYDIRPGMVAVSIDLSGLVLNDCEEILILNEQGSTAFATYIDSDGSKLSGREIGAWDAVEADRASLVDVGGQLSFSLKKMRPATLFRGWERTRNRFSWAGLSYSLHPNDGLFKYSIELTLNPDSC